MTNLAEQFASLIDRAQQTVDYWRDVAINDFTRELHARMQELGIKHAELAERLGTSRPYVTKQLSGGNFTLETMAKFAMALDCVVRIHLEGQGEAEREKSAEAGVIVNLAMHRAMVSTSSQVTTDGTGTGVVTAAWGR